MVIRRKAKARAVEQDIDEARRFLEALAPGEKEFQFATWDDNPKRDEVNKSLAGSSYESFGKASTWLLNRNDQHAGVFVSLNVTDGNGRKKENVKRVRAIMADLDGEPLDAVRQCALKPHIIVETSENHFHVFWCVEPNFPIDQWENVVRGCAKRFDSDPAVATLERCARLPGFFHCKDIDNRQLVKIVEVNALPPYTTDEIVKEFPPQKKPHKPPKSGLILPVGAPLVAAEEYVNARYMLGEIPLLRHYRGAFYLWEGTHYRLHRDEVLEKNLYAFLKSALARKENNKIVPYNPNKSKVAEVAHALRRSALLIPEEWEVPFWLGPINEQQVYKPAGDLIACRNGILNLETRELIPHDPLFFTPNALTFDYDKDAPEPKRFYKFLDSLELDEETENTLQEIFGYLLTNDTRQQKIFLIVGPKRGGKGTLVFVLEQMLGSENITFQTLDSLTGEFGRWPLIDKKLAVFADARLGTRGNIHRLVETLLSISGGDPQTINRKYGTFWTGRLGVRFLMTTNNLPKFKDTSGTIASRFIMLAFTQSFYNREDINLKSKLLPELPGILNWALNGLDRLRKYGYFEQPAASKPLIEVIEGIAAPVKDFLKEWCEVRSDMNVLTKVFYQAYRYWAEDGGLTALPNNTFGVALRDLVPTLKTKGIGARRKYVGVCLSEEGQAAWEQLLVEKGKQKE
jgi:putative DNA primase/helicase